MKPMINSVDTAGNKLKYANRKVLVVRDKQGKYYSGETSKTIKKLDGFANVVMELNMHPLPVKSAAKAFALVMKTHRVNKFAHKPMPEGITRKAGTRDMPVNSTKPEKHISHKTIRALLHLAANGMADEANQLAKDLGIK